MITIELWCRPLEAAQCSCARLSLVLWGRPPFELERRGHIAEAAPWWPPRLRETTPRAAYALTSEEASGLAMSSEDWCSLLGRPMIPLLTRSHSRVAAGELADTEEAFGWVVGWLVG